MQIAMIGLGKMGANMTRRLARHGIAVQAFDASAAARESVAKEENVDVQTSLEGIVAALSSPRIVWIMLPAGEITQSVCDQLRESLSKGDVVIDGGNAHYKDSVRRAEQFAKRGIRFVDAGVSGGVWGLANGYGLMVGGDDESVRHLKPVFDALAPPSTDGRQTWVHCGIAGSGHYTKMVHNGIEYGLMQSYAEGVALLQAKSEFSIDLAAVTESWRHGTVIRSWLLDLMAEFLAKDATLAEVLPHVADSGEGRWTALEAIELGVPAPVIGAALNARLTSQGHGDFADKLLAQMRNSFGGHAVEHSSG